MAEGVHLASPEAINALPREESRGKITFVCMCKIVLTIQYVSFMPITCLIT